MSERCWLAASPDADRMATWMCGAARELVPNLGARGHTVVHAVANALADDAAVNGQAPLDLAVATTRGGIEISVTDGRDCDARTARPLPPVIEEIRSLTSSITMQRASGRAGCTLTAAIPLRRTHTLRSRLASRRRGRP